jgi:L-2-hydroxyglutarate oxidase LhgO
LSNDTDFLVIGSGVIGLAIGIALLESKPSLKVVIFEKEKDLGRHASGRNSGVIHAGFYYSPDSLKAKFCANGNRELKKICRENRLPLIETGKVVVTSSMDQVERLEVLYKRGIENKIDLELLDASQLKRIEPTAKTFEKFLWSPTTAVGDPESIIEYLFSRFKRLGGVIAVGQRIEIRELKGSIRAFALNKEIPANQIINSGGVHANQLARSIGVGTEFACLPFMGIYRVAEKTAFSPKTLIYPVPHPINPFLGVHITLTLEGDIKIGPTAIPLFGREQYSIRSRVDFSEFKDSLRAMWSMVRGGEYDLPEILRDELPKIITKKLVKDVHRLVPDIDMVGNWHKNKPGIRAQLVNINSGKLEQDFIVRRHLNSTHVLNAVSPGWTSALPFGRWVAESVQ